jgi:hypothetical protein
MALHGKTTLRKLQQAVDNRTPFRAGNISGRWEIDAGSVPVGRLPAEYHPVHPSGPLFVIYSYQTPVAWYRDGEWTVPDVKYSASTSNHQSNIWYMIQRTGICISS